MQHITCVHYIYMRPYNLCVCLVERHVYLNTHVVRECKGIIHMMYDILHVCMPLCHMKHITCVYYIYMRHYNLRVCLVERHVSLNTCKGM